MTDDGLYKILEESDVENEVSEYVVSENEEVDGVDQVEKEIYIPDQVEAC